MTWESGASDQQRLRAGYAVLSVGVFLLLCVWGLAVMRGPEGIGEVAVRGQKIKPPTRDQRWPVLGAGMILVGVVLVVVFVVSLVALIRMSRQYRKLLLHKPSQPTSRSDVWKMHKVPEEPPTGDPPVDTSRRGPSG